MKVLVIYELIPEDTKMYVVEAEGEELEKIKAAHGVYVNIDEDDEPASWLNEYLDGRPEVEISPGHPILADFFDLVVHSGFHL